MTTVRITSDPVWSYVECDDITARYLYDSLSFHAEGYAFSPAYKKGYWDGKVRFFDLKKNRIRTGLVPVAARLLESRGVEVSLPESREHNVVFGDKDFILYAGGRTFDLGKPPYDYQKASVIKAIRAKRGVLNIGTNGGKTLIALAMLRILNRKSLYLVHNKEILDQTYRLFRSVRDTPVGVYASGMRKNTSETITIGMVQSLYNAAKYNGVESDFFEGVEVLVIDECHHARADSYIRIADRCVNAEYRIGLSGTPWKGRPDSDFRIVGILGPEIFRVPQKYLIESGISSKPSIIMYRSVFEGEERSDLTYGEVVSKHIVHNEKRNRMILDLVHEKHSSGKSVLVISHKQHIRRLFRQYVSEHGSDGVYLSHGTVPDQKRMENVMRFAEEGGVMMASSVFDEGISIDNIDVLVLAGSSKSYRQIIQRIGRSIRKKTYTRGVEIIDFYNWHHYYLRNHSRYRLDLYRKEGLQVEER